MKNLLLFVVILFGSMRVTFAQTDCVDINYSETFYNDLGEFTVVDAFGNCSWFWYSSYHCAYVNSYNCDTGDDDWLISPSFDLSEMVSASFSFTQANAYGSSPANWPAHCQVLVSSDYAGNPATATWEQLAIPNWGSSNWTWQTQNIDLPSNYLGENSVTIAFRYVTDSVDFPAWEIKDFTFIASCTNSSSSTIVFNGQPLTNYVNRTVTFGQTLHVCGRYGNTFYLSYERLRQPQEMAIEGTALFDSLRTKCDNAILTATFNGVWGDSIRTGATLDNLEATVVGERMIVVNGSQVFGNNERPTHLPELGDGRLLVCAANLEYYCPDWEGTFSAAESDSDFLVQHTKLTKAFAHIGADIYAVTEIQNGNRALADIVDGLNELTDFGRYTYVQDHDTEVNDYTKVGFIYRTDKVTPVLELGRPYENSWVYSKREYVQAFEEISTGERFVLSMNHFKAQEGMDDTSTNEIRMQNVEQLVEFLEEKLSENYYQDSDILIVGDLNCSTMAEPIRYLSENGYENQLSVYSPDEYSYVFNNEIEYLDHAFASPSLAVQITGAAPYHLNADEPYAVYFPSGDTTIYRYSDHDPVLIALNLYTPPTDTNEISTYEMGENTSLNCRINSSNNRIFVENLRPADVVVYDMTGRTVFSQKNVIRCEVALKPAVYVVKSGSVVKKVVLR